ncbi:hypothetical protein [Thermaurantiacus sp.]
MVGFDAARAELQITLAYGASLLLLLLAWRNSPEGRARRFWLVAALLILGLGLNKPLDLQTSLTSWGRQLARDGDSYAMRRQVQAEFIAGLAVAMAVAAAGLGFLVRRLGPPAWLALFGLWGLSGFVLLRAISFHHLDALLRLPLFGTRAWVSLELAGIALVALGAALALRR